MASTERRVEVSAAISVTEALTIVGDTGNPADVVVRNTAGTVTKTSGSNADTAHRVFVINNAGAVLSGLVAEDGRAGGGIGIKNIGGDCIVRNCTIVGNTANTHSAGIRIENRATGNSTAKGVVINTIAVNNMKSGAEVNYLLPRRCDVCDKA